MRIPRFAGALLAALLLAAGCGGAAKPTQPAPAAQEPKLTRLSIRLDWTPNALHAPIYAAAEKGYYKAEGLDVQINPATDKDDVLKLIDTGVDTVGLYYQSSVMKAQAKGYNVKAFGAYVQHPLNVILVDQRAGIKTLKDLEGKSVGFTSDPQPKGALSTTAASLKMMVEKAGGDFSKIQLVNAGETGVQALATQKVHALGGVYEYHEKFLLDKEGIKTDVYRLHEHGAPDFYELVLITSEQNAAANAEALKKFVKATEQGVKLTREKPDEVVEILLKAAPTLKKELVKSAVTVVAPLYQETGKAFGLQERDRWEKASRWMLENKLITAAPDFDKLLTK